MIAIFSDGGLLGYLNQNVLDEVVKAIRECPSDTISLEDACIAAKVDINSLSDRDVDYIIYNAMKEVD